MELDKLAHEIGSQFPQAYVHALAVAAADQLNRLLCATGDPMNAGTPPPLAFPPGEGAFRR